MSGQDSFEIASAVAAIFGLAAALVLALGAMVFTWLLFRRAGEAALTTTRLAVSMEDLLRSQPGHTPFASGGEGGQYAELRAQAETLVEQQRRLQEMARNLLETAALDTGPAPAVLGQLEATVSRLDATVGQMAASLANLIQTIERERR